MSQTAYTVTAPQDIPGLLGDPNSDAHIRSFFNEEATAMEPGLAVEQGTLGNEILRPAGVGGDFVGITVWEHQEDRNLAADESIPANGGRANVLSKGRIWVQVEEAIALADSVFYRHTAEGGNTELGRFRTDADGVAEVSTLTPTAVNDATYAVRVIIAGTAYTFHVLGDGSATATEICDDFRTQMAADATFTALVVATGAATLILTGQNTGQELDVTDVGVGVMAIVETTPPAPSARELTNAKWRTTTAGAGIAELELNLP